MSVDHDSSTISTQGIVEKTDALNSSRRNGPNLNTQRAAQEQNTNAGRGNAPLGGAPPATE